MTLHNLNTQKIKLHTNSENISEIKLPSLIPSAQNSHLIHNSNSPCLGHLLFFPNYSLVPLQVLSYRELNVVACISSLDIKFYFLSLGLQYWFYFWNLLPVESSNTKQSVADFCIVEQIATIYLPPRSNFEIHCKYV